MRALSLLTCASLSAMVINECLLQATRWEEEAAEVSGYLKERGLDGENLDCGICRRRGEVKKKSRLTLGLGKNITPPKLRDSVNLDGEVYDGPDLEKENYIFCVARPGLPPSSLGRTMLR